MTVPTVRISELGTLERLDNGGQAVVYRVPEYTVPNPVLPAVRGRLVFKKYKAEALKGREMAAFHGLARLVDLRQDIRNITIDLFSVWPLAVVVPDDAPNHAAGLLMRELPSTCFVDLQLLTSTKRKVFSIGQLLQSDADLAARGLPVPSDRERLVLLIRLVDLYSALHENRIILGDISSNNVVVRCVANAKDPYHPMLVDVDTIRVQGEGAAFSQGTTPDWAPPEALRLEDPIERARTTGDSAQQARLVAMYNAQNFASDVYKAALLVLRMMHEGDGHSAIRSSESAAKKLTGMIGAARTSVVLKALDETPENRPTMSELALALAGRRLR